MPLRAAAAAARDADRPRRQRRGADRGDAQRGDGPRRLGAAVPGDRRAGASGAESAAEAMRQLHELISVMRLFKAGGVGLGPHAFAPTGEGRWRRIATGAPAARPGGYDAERGRGRAAGRARRRAGGQARPRWRTGLGGRRFEMGCERASALEGLSDHLLALRAVLDGAGPGRRLAADARRGADRRTTRPRRGRRPRADRGRAGAGALADARRAGRRHASSWPAGSRKASAESSARPRSASSAPTSAPPPTRP